MDRYPVLGVVGGSGGVGASSFAAVLAAAAARPGRALLVDLDPLGGGVDVLLGAESVAGARWTALRLAGGRLDVDVLYGGLPAWRSVSVLAADGGVMPGPAAVGQVIDVACLGGPVVCDLARWPSAARAAAVERCRLVVAVARADVTGVLAAAHVADGLGDTALGILVRSSAPVPDGLFARPVLGRVPVLPAVDLAAGLPAALTSVAEGVVEAVRDG